MAKLKPKQKQYSTDPGKDLHIQVRVRRRGYNAKGGAEFESCVRLPGSGSMLAMRRGRFGMFCANGRNPRRSTAAALRRASAALDKRSGAFAGLKGK